MTLVQILVVVLIIVLICGGLPFGPWYAPPPNGPAPTYHGYGWGWNAGGLLGTILIIILVLWLLRVL